MSLNVHLHIYQVEITVHFRIATQLIGFSMPIKAESNILLHFQLIYFFMNDFTSNSNSHFTFTFNSNFVCNFHSHYYSHFHFHLNLYFPGDFHFHFHFP